MGCYVVKCYVVECHVGDGMLCLRLRWNGMSWDVVGRRGTSWNVVECSVVECYVVVCYVVACCISDYQIPLKGRAV